MANYRILTLMAIFCYTISHTINSAYGRTAAQQSTIKGFDDTPSSYNDDETYLTVNRNNKKSPRQLNPNADRDVEVIEQFDRRNANGTYEYKFVLSNGVTRYEKSYWIQVGYRQVLAVKGYFTQRFSNGKYLARFYTVDANGFHEDLTSWTDTAPVLPDKLDDPENMVTAITSRRPLTSRPSRPARPPTSTSTTTTTRRPRRTTTTTTTTASTVQNNEPEYYDQNDYRENNDDGVF